MPTPSTDNIEASCNESNSYSRIVKSSSLIGGAQGINMLIGMVRVKFVAILIGPVGVGLLGTYRATVQLIGTIAGLGINSSAVRDVVEAIAANDQERLGQTILTLRRICWIIGGVGSLVVVLLSRHLSQITFNSTEHTYAIAMVGLTILFTNIQGGQMALIQGMRRIGDLARLNVFGTVAGSVVSVSLYFWLGLQGIVPAILALSILQLAASWWFANKVPVPKVTMSWADSIRAAGGMVKLGLAFMWSSLLVAAVAYATRMLITREIDLVAVGVFTAAFSLSGMVVNFILGAMGADYYPSLTAISTDHPKMGKLVNEQSEIGLLLALPGLLATLSFAPWIIKIFYTSAFTDAADLLQWFVLGCLGRVISWPMGYIILAKGATRLFALTETITNILHVALIWVLLNWYGVDGVAIAFATLYLAYTVFMLAVARYLIGFLWSRDVWILLTWVIPVVAFTFVIGKLLQPLPATIIGLVITFGASVFCLRGLAKRLGPEHTICRFGQRIPFVNQLFLRNM